MNVALLKVRGIYSTFTCFQYPAIGLIYSRSLQYGLVLLFVSWKLHCDRVQSLAAQEVHRESSTSARSMEESVQGGGEGGGG